MMKQAEFLAEELIKTRGWTKQLLADFSGADWGYQPQPGMSHAIWLIGHISLAQHGLVAVRCFGEAPLESAYADPFKIGSTPLPVDQHTYPGAEELLTHFDRVQETVVAKVRGMSDEDLTAPVGGKPHPMFTTKGGAVVHSTRHEAFHTGQIATLRRLLGRAPLR